MLTTRNFPDPQRSETLPHKVRRLLWEELSGINWKLIWAQMVLKLIPKHVGSRIRPSVLRWAGFNIGDGTIIWALPEFTGHDDIFSMLSIGERCWLNAGLYFDLGAKVTIGNRVSIGHDVLFMTGCHHLNTGSEARRAGDWFGKPITVADRVWIGARCTILPGVTIGAGAVIAAGATVTRDVASNTIVAGVPARFIRNVAADEEEFIDAAA